MVQPLQTPRAHPIVSPDAVEKIKAIGLDRAPHESCGIILGIADVIELTNHSDEPLDSYAVDRDDILDAVEEWLGDGDCDVDKLNLVIWHTHPGGNIGPSGGDLAVRQQGVHYLVVTLPNGEATQY